MAPPWVTFDSASSYNGTCADGADPDIAGIGVVGSFVIASIMTTIASISAMLLDHAFDAKGRFSAREPLKFARERFLDTEWKKAYQWRPLLDPLIIGLGDQQLITGYAVLLSGWIKVGQNAFEVQGAHFVLSLYICALSSSSHLAALITLRKYFRKYKLIAKIRLTLVIFFAIFLLTSMIAAICMPPTVVEDADGMAMRTRAQRMSFLVPLILILLGFSTALVCILYDPRRRRTASHVSGGSGRSMGGVVRRITDSKPRSYPPLKTLIPSNLGFRLLYHVFIHPLIAFAIQILLAVLSVVLVLTQKFAVPQNPEFCGLQNEGDNEWGFGQTLSMVMLLLPAMSAGQTYLEGRHDILK